MNPNAPFLPIAKPWIDQQEVDAAARAILSGWVTQGPEVLAFEQEFAAMTGARHACAVSSCTTALHLALLLAGVGPGDEVITVSHSFIATANAVRYCGAEPVFVDIEPETFNLNPALIEAAITPKSRAILCVHQVGMPCDMARILDVAHRHGLKVVEDAACAIGSQILFNGEWQRIGRPQADIACFSFHPRKVVTTGDGGMLTTNNPEYDHQFRLLRQHGMNVPDTVRHGARQVIFETYPIVGYNYRMTDIQAAIGRVQLSRLDQIVEVRRRYAGLYHQLLAGVEGVTPPREPAWARSNWQSYCVRLDEAFDQEQVMQFMLDRNIATRRGVMCAHLEDAYGGRPSERLRESERAQQHSIVLPLFHTMTEADLQRVVSTLADALNHARRG